MKTETLNNSLKVQKADPLCPVFGICGGCSYQDIPYEDELLIKEGELKRLFKEELLLSENIFGKMVPSPESYHYRSRLDLGVLKTKKGDFLMGFYGKDIRRLIPVESCAIARKEISDFLPELRRQSEDRLPRDYQTANLVIKSGDERKVFWGGIGRKSLQMREEDYLWTEVCGKKIFYSLETFFQANLSILPVLIRQVQNLAALDAKTLFLDLYAGVGLFGICLAEFAKKVVMIEEHGPSVKLAQFNAAFHGLSEKIEIHAGKAEEVIPLRLAKSDFADSVVLVDPPRQGLKPAALEALAKENFRTLLYLSCYPPSLIRDLKVFIQKGWKIEKVIPFDFFPKTSHIETLALLKHEP